MRYDATALRPAWDELPAQLRTAVQRRLGDRVAGSVTAGGGFTRGFAAVLTTAGGQRHFVKAARLADQRHLAEAYYREALITQALPAGVPAARPRWTTAAAGWYVICLEAVAGAMPRLPWRADELAATLDAWAAAARALHDPPPALVRLGLPRLAELLRGDLCWWQDVQAGRVPVPPAPGAAGPLDEHLADLVALEAALPGYADSAALTHGDLRVDNVLIDTAGAAWICDWTWACHGAPWFDTAGLLVTAHRSGLAVDQLCADHPTWAGAPAEALDAALAALAGYWLGLAAHGGPTDASPAIRDHQRFSGEAALAWLAQRRGWPPVGSAPPVA